MEEITPEEFMVVCMARQVRNGEVVAQGLATPLVSAAYLLARYTHAPDLYFMSAIGQGVCRQPAPLSLSKIESLWLDRALLSVGFVRAAADALPSLRPLEFFRPAQLDPFGNFNNVAFGRDYLTTGRHHPRLRLPGTGGIPDVTTFINEICLYVPRHSRLTFVSTLDVCSGLGYSPNRRHGRGPGFLVTDLGEFDYANGRMRLVTFHPGVTIEHIQSRTGFELEIAPDVRATTPPTAQELHLLRNVIDPSGIRRLESLSGAARRLALHEILTNEARQSNLAG
jgi:acyl CoA:acetate/3-ketoacid CoA transferase beta subunit